MVDLIQIEVRRSIIYKEFLLLCVRRNSFLRLNIRKRDGDATWGWHMSVIDRCCVYQKDAGWMGKVWMGVKYSDSGCANRCKLVTLVRVRWFHSNKLVTHASMAKPAEANRTCHANYALTTMRVHRAHIEGSSTGKWHLYIKRRVPCSTDREVAPTQHSLGTDDCRF